jgi:hypothetical protein
MNDVRATRATEFSVGRPPRAALNEWTQSLMALRLHNRSWYPLAFLICFVSPVVAWFKFTAGQPPTLLISAIGGIIGVFYFLYHQHLDETKLFKELFTDFNSRYDALKIDLNAILFDPSEDVLSSFQREKVFNYFNLCAEEYFFYKAGYIDHDVWKSWCRGMHLFFSHPRIQGLWEQERKESYYGFQPPSSRLFRPKVDLVRR